MNIAEQIAALLEEAEPLRCLPEQEQGELGAIVDRINTLRAKQAAGYVETVSVAEEPKRGPGRPKKAQP